MKLRKTSIAALAAAAIAACAAAHAADKLVIYSNADEEAQDAMKHALDGNGFAGRYVLQAFGTSELGGKLMAEKKNIEADIITLSTYYLDSAQARDRVFASLFFSHKAADGSEVPFYCALASGTSYSSTSTTAWRPKCLKSMVASDESEDLSVPRVGSDSNASLFMSFPRTRLFSSESLGLS